MTKQMTTSRMVYMVRRGFAPLALAVAAGACSLEVTNPGPVQATALESPAALASVVSGTGRDLAEAMNWVGYTGAAVALEIKPAGSTGAFGISVSQQLGKLQDDETGTHWNFSQRARWTAEDAVKRIDRVLEGAANTSAQMAQALIYAGYANRLLGENFCDGIIDGGGLEPNTVYFQRAEDAFTRAITVATAANNAALRNAATAGRAQVRLDRNNLTGAVADAALITDNAFRYVLPYFVIDADQYNRIYWASANQPYRAHTVFGTYYDAYFKATRDSRVKFDSSLTVLQGDAAVGPARVRWLFQTKYTSQTSAIALATGWEMRLIEAEAKLVGGDVQGALDIMNVRRAALNVPALTATNATDAWVAFKRERGIELWLEGRRLGDHRRWAALNRPGVSDDMTGRDLCFVTPRGEKDANPNIP